MTVGRQQARKGAWEGPFCQRMCPSWLSVHYVLYVRHSAGPAAKRDRVLPPHVALLAGRAALRAGRKVASRPCSAALACWDCQGRVGTPSESSL